MWIIYPLIFLSGFVDSIAGGGGLISLSAYLAIGMPAHLVLGTNKFSAVTGTGIATIRFAKNGYVKWQSALYSFAGALLGSSVGARIALGIDERLLTYMMLAVVPIVALVLLRKKDFGIQEKQLPPLRLTVYSFLTGFVIGGYDGFFGPGTGTFLIMAFTSVLGFRLLHACGNAKLVNFASNIAATVVFVINGKVDYKLGIPCALCAILGNYIGSGLAMKKESRIVRPMMFVVIALLLIKIIADLIKQKQADCYKRAQKLREYAIALQADLETNKDRSFANDDIICWIFNKADWLDPLVRKEDSVLGKKYETCE